MNPNTNTPEQSAPETAEFKKAKIAAAVAYKEQCKIDRDNGALADCDFKEGAEWACRHLSQPIPSLRWVKAKDKRPAEGKDGELLTIKPITICHSYEGLPNLYTALVYMGKYDGGLAWHWHEGPTRAYATKIATEDWDKIEWLKESLLPVPQEPNAVPGHINFLSYNELVALLTEAMRECDTQFEKTGGTTRHYVMDLLLPYLTQRDICLVKLTKAAPGQPSIEPDAPIKPPKVFLHPGRR